VRIIDLIKSIDADTDPDIDLSDTENNIYGQLIREIRSGKAVSVYTPSESDDSASDYFILDPKSANEDTKNKKINVSLSLSLSFSNTHGNEFKANAMRILRDKEAHMEADRKQSKAGIK